MDLSTRGFINTPRSTASGGVYRGRLTLPAIQWTGEGSDLVGTVTLTIEQVADAAESRLIWTDQGVQRGVQPTAPRGVPLELPVADGYPDSKLYIFQSDNADDMTTKLLHGRKIFFNPLVWNLRPGGFEAYFDAQGSELFLYSGRIYLPDSHHRHQAILKAMRAFREAPSSYPDFDPNRQFKIELYFLDREDEGNYFFDKNQRTRAVALSKAYDLTTEDDLSVLAKRLLELVPDLDRGTNRATDRLSKKAPQFVTLSTLREAMRTFAGATEVQESELEGLALVAADFFRMLMDVRPELRVETPWTERDRTLASAGVMIHGYAHLMRDFNIQLARTGATAAKATWQRKLALLAPDVAYSRGGWIGDFMDRENPLWLELGITRLDRETQQIQISNSGGSRTRAGNALRGHLEAASPSGSKR